MQQLLFIIDRDREFARLAARACDESGYVALIIDPSENVIYRAEREQPSLFVLNADECTPTGAKIYYLLRQHHTFWQVPKIVVSDSPTDEECVRFLDDGVDDYVGKPINLRELTLRIHAVLTSRRRARGASLKIGPLEVDASGMIAWIDGRPISLTTTEFRILEYLARHQGRPVAREELLQGVYAHSTATRLRVVDTHVCRLRDKVEPRPGHPLFIQTIHKVGYCLSCPPNPDDKR